MCIAEKYEKKVILVNKDDKFPEGKCVFLFENFYPVQYVNCGMMAHSHRKNTS